MIGIIGAMDIEIERINAVMEEKEEFTVSGALYTRGRLDGKDVVTAVCGIGKVFAAMCAQTMIARNMAWILKSTNGAKAPGRPDDEAWEAMHFIR